MKFILILTVLLFAGCANTSVDEYALYLDAQKSISRDNAMLEASRILALVEMTKSHDPGTRATGIMLLQQLQQNTKPIKIQPPNKNWLGL
jgi:hypothetical protein